MRARWGLTTDKITRILLIISMAVALGFGSVLVASMDGGQAPLPSVRATPSPRTTPAPAPLMSPPGPGPLGVHTEEELVEAATAVVAFLRGEGDFDDIHLDETVTLSLAGREGTERLREELRRPEDWEVYWERSDTLYELAPGTSDAELTTASGRHFRCLERPLAEISEPLAQLPHVGTMLAPSDDSSCLQVWNLTLVFDPAATPPTVVAAVYDQFEF